MCSVARPGHLGSNDNANNDTVEAEGTGEDFDDEHANESLGGLSVNKGSGGTNHTDGKTADEVGNTDDETASEDNVSTVESVVIRSGVAGVVHVGVRGVAQLAVEDNGKDNTVDGDGLAEDDTDQVLADNSGHFDC